MKLGVYNAILHDRPLPEALKVIADLGLTGIEINTGGFLPAVHVPTMDQILESDAARDDYLAIFEGTGVSIAGLNCNGNPLHPKREIGEKHAEDIRRSIRLAQRLGQDRVVTMSGLPGGEPGATTVNWVVNAWNSAALDVLDYQWGIAADFWKETDRLAADHGVKVALELHPQNIVFNTADVHKLIELTGATHVGVELDASHLFWQQMDPVAVVRELGPLVFQAAAKDVRVNTGNAALYGVLDNSFRRLSPEENRTNLGGDEWANEWPKNSAWDFVALGRGHDTAYWTEFLRALYEVDPNMLVNIEHEDVSLGRIEGLQVAAKVLRDADAALSASLHLTARLTRAGKPRGRRTAAGTPETSGGLARFRRLRRRGAPFQPEHPRTPRQDTHRQERTTARAHRTCWLRSRRQILPRPLHRGGGRRRTRRSRGAFAGETRGGRGGFPWASGLREPCGAARRRGGRGDHHDAPGTRAASWCWRPSRPASTWWRISRSPRMRPLRGNLPRRPSGPAWS